MNEGKKKSDGMTDAQNNSSLFDRTTSFGMAMLDKIQLKDPPTDGSEDGCVAKLRKDTDAKINEIENIVENQSSTDAPCSNSEGESAVPPVAGEMQSAENDSDDSDSEEEVEPPKKKKRLPSASNLSGEEDLCELIDETVTESFNAENLLSCLSGLFNDAKEIPGMELDDSILKNLELICALMNSLIRAEHWDQVVSAFTLYFNNFTEHSITGTCLHYMQELFDFTPQSLEKGQDDLPAFIRLMRLGRENFSLLKGNPLFGHFSKFLGLVVAVGLCETSQVSFELGTYKMFEPCMKTAHGGADNVLEAIFQSVTFFIERIYFCFKNKSIRPLLMSDGEAADIDEEIAQLNLFWALHRNGNLYDVKGLQPCEFERRLNSMGFKLQNLLRCKSGMEKQVVRDKYQRILIMISDMQVLNASGDIREAPFHVQLYGDSGVGKSTAMYQLNNVLLAAQGLPLDPIYRAAINCDDPYMSNWTSDKIVMILDDFANTKQNRVATPPTKFIILAKNNAPAYAPKAEIEGKGKCAIKPLLMFTTTNCKDLAASESSVNPYSIQGRSDYVLVIKNRPECLSAFHGAYTIDGKKCDAWHASNGRDNSMVEDIWLVDIQKAVRPKDESHLAEYRNVFNAEGKELKNLSMQEVAVELIKFHQTYRKQQEDILRKAKEQIKVDYTLCGINGCKCPRNICLDHKQMTVQSGRRINGGWIPQYRLDSTINRLADQASESIKDQFSWMAFNAEGVTTVALLAAGRVFSHYFDWMVLLPESWVRNEYFMSFAMICNKERITKEYVKNTITNWLPVVGFTALGCLEPQIMFIAIMFGIFATLRQMAMIVTVKDAYRAELIARNDTISSSVKSYRDNVCAAAGKACVGLGALYILSKFLARMARVAKFEPQGNLTPKTEKDVKERDIEANVWSQVVVRKLPMTDIAKSSTSTELENKLKKNLFYAEIQVHGKTLVANILYLRTNLIVVPVHYFLDDHLEITFYKDKSKACGGRHRYKVSLSASVRIGNTDLALCYCPSGGSMGDLTDYLPTADLSSHQFHMVYRMEDGDLLRANGIASFKVANNGFASFPGGEYERLDINTFDGLCGAVVVSHGSGSIISGFHLGGRADTPRGCYGTLFAQDVIDGLGKLEQLPGVLFSGNDGKGFVPQLLNKGILLNEPTHPKSPANYLPEGSSLQYYGRCIGAKQTKTTVRDTPISPSIALVCGAPNCYQPPKLNPSWWGEQKCLANMSKPGTAYEYELLELAVRDYRNDLIDALDDYWKQTKPLTDEENFLGIDGKRFVDKLVANTSMSMLGLTPTAKSHYIEKEINEDGTIASIDFTPEIRKLIDEAEEAYKNGNRAWPIAVANKKDEILTKEKCRMFFGNPVTLSWLIRKYFLPIIRFIQMNPILSECAVGINAMGPEWEAFQAHVLKYGLKRILAGDYGKYDQKLTAQLLFAAFGILINIAEKCNYSEQDIKIMKAMVSDVVYALIAFNGDLYGIVEGTHISGNSLTVILNSICGSLNLRCAFYSMYPPDEDGSFVPFRLAVALCNYGDDNTSTVKEGYEKYNMVSVSKFLAKYGQEYTNPDKSEAKIEYLPVEDWEFLKRRNVYNPDLGVHVGALDEKSIFKSLHCYLRGKSPALTQEMACATNIDGALREWFMHGKDVYEKRRTEMQLVAQDIVNDVPVASLCRELDVTYEDRVEAWKAKYDPSSWKEQHTE